MTTAHLLVSVFCLAVLGWVLRVLVLEIGDAHRRGLARVQHGTSWTAKVTSSHDEQAAA